MSEQKEMLKANQTIQKYSTYYDYGPRIHGILLESVDKAYHVAAGRYYVLHFVLSEKYHKNPPIIVGITGCTIHPKEDSELLDDFLSAKCGDKVSFCCSFSEVRLYNGLIEDGQGIESGLRVQFCYTRDFKFEKGVYHNAYHKA